MNTTAQNRTTIDPQLGQVARASLERFIRWMNTYGETSWDVDDYFNNSYGKWAKRQYYKRPALGTLLVAPLVFQEAFTPWTRRFFWPSQRFPLSDAHYAMGHAYLYEATGDESHYKRALHFLQVLEATRCAGYQNYCWGYPFDWETVHGTFKAGTPLITTTPYGYEAFEAVHEIDGNPRWLEIMRSVAEHAVSDYRETPDARGLVATSYSPLDNRRVVNANAYRSFLLMAASVRFDSKRYAEAARKSLDFVLDAQRPDGSWFYAMENVDQFIDHYHTCFVMKALQKIRRLTGHAGCAEAIRRGIEFYKQSLLDERNLPKPFAKPPRLIIYKRELYDLSEAINLALLTRAEHPDLDRVMSACVHEIAGPFQRANGAYRTRQALIGWNNVPMHRWGSAIAFRSLAYLLRTQGRAESKASAGGPANQE